MKLSVELLLETLRDQFPVTDYHLEGGCPLLGRPLLYAPDEPVLPGQVYLTNQRTPALCRGDLSDGVFSGCQSDRGGLEGVQGEAYCRRQTGYGDAGP